MKSSDTNEYVSDRFNRTIHEALNKGYKANYARVRQSPETNNNNLFDKMITGANILSKVVLVSVGIYTAYKFYKNVYIPMRSFYDKPFVNKEPEGERVMDGRINRIFRADNDHGSLVEDFRWAVKHGRVEDAEFTVHPR